MYSSLASKIFRSRGSLGLCHKRSKGEYGIKYEGGVKVLLFLMILAAITNLYQIAAR